VIAAEVDWDAVTLAGAFVLGAAFATLATIRVMRAVFGAVQRPPIRRPTRGDDEEGS